MECIVNKASMYDLCYVDIIGGGFFSVACYVDKVGSIEFFQFRVKCKCTRAILFVNSMFM